MQGSSAKTSLVSYYNEHRHWGIGLMTPDAVHHGKATKITEQRAKTVTSAFLARPDTIATQLFEVHVV